MTDTLDADTSSRGRRVVVRTAAVAGSALFVVFWTWALFFASKEAVNRIEDRAWAERAAAICDEATERRLELADFREIADAGPELIRERADIIDAATDIIEAMLDDVVAVDPVGLKADEIVPQWEADYRTYIADRRTYANQLRESGENLQFYETAVQIPLSEKVATFAGDNSMASCAPPSDLST